MEARHLLRLGAWVIGISTVATVWAIAMIILASGELGYGAVILFLIVPLACIGFVAGLALFIFGTLKYRNSAVAK